VHLLMTGDLGSAEESSLDAPRGAILKVAHHGSRHSSPERALAWVAPPAAIISAGERNRYGHPHPEALARLARAGARVFRTDRDGAVTIESDGVRASVRAHLADGAGVRLVYARDGIPRAAAAAPRSARGAAVSRAH